MLYLTLSTRPGAWVLRSLGGRYSLRLRPRPVLVGLLLVALILVVGVSGIVFGEFPLSVGDVLGALVGAGDRYSRLVVLDYRLPRVLCAILVGLALGAAGAIFQSLSRNPLGSPDIAGFSTGAASGALLQILVVGGGAAATALGSVAGGLTAALLVYLLAYRGGTQGYRLVLVGIGLNAMLLAVNNYLVSAADFAAAQQAQLWLVGSLNGRTWGQVGPILLGLLVLGPVVIGLGRAMRMIEMGDDLAHATGVRVERCRIGLLLTGTLLAALATATAGPILFVALAAPQIARRITGSPNLGAVSAGLTGAVLLLVGDLAAQHALPQVVPVGVCTAVIGGLYLVWLVFRENRAGAG